MKNLSPILLLFLISLLPLVTLFQPGLPITHDGQDHVARIANFYTSLSEGNIIPRWAANLNWGFGHPILMFLYPLPSYAASIFHFLGLSLVDSVKAVFGVSFVLSALFMYFWLKSFLGVTSGLIGATLYAFSSYRFVDLYVRGAIGEHVAFVFLPAICYFLLKLNFKKEFNFLYFLGLGLSTAGLILSHNAISLMFFPIVAIYVFYLFFINKSKFRFGLSIISVIYGFLLSSFFWIPAYLEGKYTLRDIVTIGEALNRFVNFSDIIYGPWNFGITGQFSTQLGILQWIFVLAAPYSLYRFYKNKKERKTLVLLLLMLFILLFSIFLMLPISKPIWEIFTILQKFQFPWRFLSISVFSTSVIGALVVYSFTNTHLKKIILIFVVVLSLVLTKDYWNAKGFQQKSDSFYNGIYNSTTDTGESSPIWSVRFMEKKAKDTIEIIEGEASIRKISRKSTKHSYEIVSQGNSRIKENTLFFPGWKVYVDGKNQDIQFQDPRHRGLMTFYLTSGKHSVDIIFKETKLRQIADLISVLSLGTLVLLWLGYKRQWLKI